MFKNYFVIDINSLGKIKEKYFSFLQDTVAQNLIPMVAAYKKVLSSAMLLTCPVHFNTILQMLINVSIFFTFKYLKRTKAKQMLFHLYMYTHLPYKLLLHG